MNILSLLMVFLSVTYIYVGIYVICLDKKAALNRLFFILNLSFALWSFALTFFISAADKSSCVLWDKIASIGYYSFASFALHFFLLYTKKNKLLKKWWIYIILYLPAAVFIFEKFTADPYVSDYFHGSYGWTTIINTGSVWFWANSVQYIIYCIIGLFLCYMQRRRSVSPRERKQAGIILTSGFLAFTSGSVIYFSTMVVKTNIPNISVLGMLIWSLGILYGIIRYKLMKLTLSVAAEDILQTIIDSLILVDPQGVILSANSETSRLLKYTDDELTGQRLGELFTEDSRFEGNNIIKLLEKCPIQNMESFFRSKEGAKIPVIISASECKDNNNDLIGYVVISRDITRLKDMEERLKYLAHHDSLTNLPNRLLFSDRLNQALARAKRYNMYVAVMLLDLDRFKEVNDILGHNTGDLLLVEAAKRLTSSVRKSDTVVRLGGDEFVILLSDMKDPDDYEIAARKILARIAELYMIGMNMINITASIGISVYPVNGNDMENLMKSADLAMYSAKNHGKNRYQLFSPSMSMEVTEKVDLENSLREVLANNELLLFYQPVIDISTGTIIGVEALVRWGHPEYGIMPPSRFIPLAEESGMIIPIGEWVLRTACMQAKAWQDSGYMPAHISVNLSLQQFLQKDLIDKILEIINETGLDPQYLLLEITESTIMHDMEKSTAILEKLYENKILVIIDDFSAGYSSLLYLRRLPVYAIKIDRFFTTDIVDDQESAAIVSAIIAMAHNMKLKVYAEGIENDGQFECLRTLDWQFAGSPVCDGAQGYLFSRPVPGDIMNNLFEKQLKGHKIYCMD